MKPSGTMDPSGPHDVLHRISMEHLPHVDHTLAASVITSLAVTTPVAMMVADTAIRLISSALITVFTSLIVGWINRRMAIRAARDEIARVQPTPEPPAPPAPPPAPPPAG